MGNFDSNTSLSIESKKMEGTALSLGRYFTQEGNSPFQIDPSGNKINWIEENVNVTDDRGKLIFTQPNVRRPDFWSSLAIKVVASKYFWGNQEKGEREDSVEKLVGRVARYFARQAVKQGYFNEKNAEILKDEITAICLNQFASFNSPVWFNAGIQDYDKAAGGVAPYKWDNQAGKVIQSAKSDDRPQCSACFIQSVDDSMESIMALQFSEAMLFKAGSGTGTNRSNLRSSKERLTGGGRASGPVSFMKGYDAYAGVIKSGGKTRRAAKMEILNVDHPDIMEFIESKQKEEKKAWALMEGGYSGGMNGEAYATVAFQNCNMSVRAQDNFMEAVKADGEWQTKAVKGGEIIDSYKAKDVLRKLAEGTWLCGDPGMQFDTIINRYHTCKGSGRINASNPCVTGDTKVLLKDGKWVRIDSIVGKKTDILVNTGIINQSEIEGSFKTGTKPIYKLSTKSGYELKLTADHKVFTVNRGFVPACELTKDDYLLIPASQVSNIIELDEKQKAFYQMVGVYLGDGCATKHGRNRQIMLTMNKYEEVGILQRFAERVAMDYARITHKNSPAVITSPQTTSRFVITNNLVINQFEDILDLKKYSHEKVISNQIFNLALGEQKYILQGLFTADGTVANYGEKAQYVALDSTSLQLMKDVQIMLLGFGIKSKLYLNRRAGKTKSFLPDGKGGMKEYDVREVHSLRISRSSRIKFEKLIGFMPESLKANRLKLLNEMVEVYEDKPFEQVESLDYIGIEEVYDLTEPMTHSFVANGITIHNCSEYMFIDDSACNLASINLMKFVDDGKFEVEKFEKAVKYFIIAQELAVDGSSYPTDKITKNSHDFRPLGLGYANLGAMLMSLGLPYDSDSGRAVAAAITAIMGGEAYKVSAQLASLVGPFPRYKENKDSMLDVIKLHRENVKKIQVEKIPEQLRYLVNDAWDAWTEALELGEKYGYRNAQVTVLAPTGCLIGNSLISTDEGLVRLTSLGNKKGEQWQNVSFKIMTDQGPKDATKFYVNGQASTRKIKTSCGYEIQGTEKHRIKVLDTTNNKLIWKRFDEVNEEDIIPLAVNTIFGDEKEVLLPLKPELHWNADFELKTPEKMNKELAEIIGYFMGDGSFHSKGLRFCVDNKDLDVVEKLSNLIKNVFNLEVSITPQKGYKEVAVNSVPLTFWWEACGFSKIKPSENHKGKGYTPHIPDAILHTNDRKIYTSFLKGLFEADGTISSGVPAMSTASNEFAKEIRTLLLALGYPTTTKIDKSGWGESDLYVLRLKNISYNKNFVDNIGFISNRKVNGINLSKSSQSGKNDRVYISEEIIDETVPIGSKYRNSALLSMKRNHAISRDMAIQIYQDTKHPQLLWAMQFFYDGVESNSDGGIQSTYDLSVPENVTYTANGFISHNTIAFLMDCDTTGIEPDIALVKYKVLAGGGMLKIVNRSVSLALKNLGYNENQIREIIEYVDKNDTIEGSSVKDEHLSIFDCAFKAAKGKRSIQYSGHINMMSGVQPFLSGAISKTINMPENSTVEDIMDAYVMSWEKGLKAVAIYRENSKRAQPLNTKKTDGEMVKREEVIKEVVVLGQRKKLPQTRRSLTHKFDIAGHEGYVMIGLYDDGKPGELFVTMHKEGSTIRGLMDAWATSVSLNLQYGASVNDLFDKFRYQKFEPSGFVRNPGGGDMSDKIKQIRTASSIVDYVAQFMLNNFGEGSGTMKVEIKTLEPEVETQLSIKDFHKEEESDEKASQKVSPEGLTCPHCGGPAKRLGNCAIFCTSCKQTTRSGCGE